MRAFGAAPATVRVGIAAIVLLVLLLTVNWVYQVVRKPAELFFPVSGALSKTPMQTWRSYAPIFSEHATAVITPDFLAALAQVEAAGNPVARTYWRWRPTTEPFDVYRPASSAVGMYQITDGTFRQAKRYCIHQHVAVEDGPWHEFGSCWFNSLYLRVVPSNAVEMTSAFLDRRVARLLDRESIAAATLAQKQDLAIVIHLCGPAAAIAYAKRKFHVGEGLRCGDQDLARYLARVNAVKRVFAGLANGG